LIAKTPKKKGIIYSTLRVQCKKPIWGTTVRVKNIADKREIKPINMYIAIADSILIENTFFTWGNIFTVRNKAANAKRKSSTLADTCAPGIFKKGNFG